VVFNAEYYFDIMGMVRALAFFDAGCSYRWEEPIDLRKLKMSYGGELRFTMPVLNVPFRLIYAINPNLDDVHKTQWSIRNKEYKFSVGTTF
jgi:outer membrane protein assembly factor BamA